MSGNSRAYAIGVSHIVVGLSTTVEIVPRSGVLSGFLEIYAGSGASNFVAVVNGISNIWSEGYHILEDVKFEIEGPAKFFLAAAGATMTVNYVQRLSAGATLG